MTKELSANSTLSHYRIVSKIGGGGMGEVYRAHDSRLDREVAIKVLPDEVTGDEDRLRRFEQEAKATSALNHPNILTVYDIGEYEGSPFIVAELLDGEELRARLDDGPMPIRKVIDYAQQIVSGLSAAHERGIIHRDLKPENLFITSDDRVKILDFGLAKLNERETNIHGSEDATRRGLTNPGVIMGTAGYMSPEQVRGVPVDHRSDIFSFGVVLYEMLSGRRAFHGESVIELMNAIIKEDVPDLDLESRRVPPALDKLMRRCLEKKPEQRFYSAHDLGFALDALSTTTTTSGSGLTTAIDQTDQHSGSKGYSTVWLPWAIAGVFLLSTLLALWLYVRRPEAPPAPAVRFSMAPPEKTTFAEALAVSPDGQRVAFVAIGGSGVRSLWVRHLSSVEPRQLAGTEGALFPFWSPDGRQLGFFAGGKLRKVDAAGGPIQSIADASGDPRGAAWAADGTILFSPDTVSPIMRVAAAGGAVTAFTAIDNTTGQTSHRWPSMLPDGRRFIFFGRGGAERQGLYLASIDQPQPVFIVAANVAGAYAEAAGKGHLLFVRDSTLVAQSFDVDTNRLSGEPLQLVQRILSFPTEIGPTGYTAFSLSAGTLLYRTGDQQTTQLTWFDRAGRALEEITEPGNYHEPSLSADAKKVVFGRDEAGSSQDIFLMDLTRGNSTRLTFDPALDVTPSLSFDDSQVYFMSLRSGKRSIYRKAATGAGNDELIYTSDQGNPYPGNATRDGKYLVFEMDGGTRTKVDLWVLPLAGDPVPIPFLQTDFVESHPQFSPDGRWIAYSSDESGRSEVYIQSFPVSGGKWQISTAGGDQAQWRGDGKELYYMAADRNLMSVTIGVGPIPEIGRPSTLFQTTAPLTGMLDDKNNYVPTPDGQRFLVNALSDTGATVPLTVVLNWAADLK